ncbi:hypothetical protein TSMEX_001949, partial [Taenia solium]
VIGSSHVITGASGSVPSSYQLPQRLPSSTFAAVPEDQARQPQESMGTLSRSQSPLRAQNPPYALPSPPHDGAYSTTAGAYSGYLLATSAPFTFTITNATFVSTHISSAPGLVAWLSFLPCSFLSYDTATSTAPFAPARATATAATKDDGSPLFPTAAFNAIFVVCTSLLWDYVDDAAGTS